MNPIQEQNSKSASAELRDAISRASGTIIRNIELLYSKEHPFDLARRNVLDVMGDRGLVRELTSIIEAKAFGRGGK